MKLVIQIPCYNEERTLGQTIADLPREIAGISEIAVLVIDDGSTDRTREVALACGVDQVVAHAANRGLAAAFRTGLDAALALGADVVVNTDADNQYVGRDVAPLVRPILEGRADLVIGDRRTGSVEGFSWIKRLLQRLGSATVRRLSGLDVPDAVSGFRALTRDAALRLNVLSTFSYTIETLIQAGRERLRVESVPVGVNPPSRPSRLFRGIPSFLAHSIATMLRTYTLYSPLKVFTYLGLALGLAGSVPIVRFLYFYASGDGLGHVQSLILGSALWVAGFVTLLLGLVTDLIASNRKLLEALLEKVRRLELEAAARARTPD